jgi:hypothetical protein
MYDLISVDFTISLPERRKCHTINAAKSYLEAIIINGFSEKIRRKIWGLLAATQFTTPSCSRFQGYINMA